MEMWRRSKCRQKVSSEMEKVLQRTDERNQLAVFFNWLSDTFERASVRDHDRYVAGATNAREASQRLHEIERGVPSFHAEPVVSLAREYLSP